MTRDESAGIGEQPRPARDLGELIDGLSGVWSEVSISGTVIRGIRVDSSLVEPGDLFVAVPGTLHDGHEYVGDAVARGAAAVVLEREISEEQRVPVVLAEDTRATLADLAARWYDEPAHNLFLVGISGSVGKTSILNVLAETSRAAGVHLGTIGSLGIDLDGRHLDDTGHTAPDPLTLHQSLARLVAEGSGVVAMEVTSHALAQQRFHGLTFGLGIFSNLLPLEHLEYHDNFADYVATKRRFFDHLDEGAPLVYNGDDKAVVALTEDLSARRISCGMGEGNLVRITVLDVDPGGTTLRLTTTGPLPRFAAPALPLVDLRCRTRLLGRSNVYNLALATVAALVLGVPPEAAVDAIATLSPPRRRLEMILDAPFAVLDDTAGHPDSVNAVFEAVEALRPRRLIVVVAIRGSRGEVINRRTAETLSIWARRTGPAGFFVTTSVDTADARNRVSPPERAAFLEPLRDAGVPYREEDRLEDALHAALETAGPGDLLVLLGAQGMDDGAGFVQAWLRNRGQLPE